MGLLSYVIWLIIQAKPHITGKRIRRVILALGSLLALWMMVLLFIIFTYGENNQVDDGFQPVDVIMVLGAGLESDGSAGKALTRRSEHAVELYHMGVAPYVICTGGIGRYQSKSEASVCKELLIEYGVPADVIFLEEESGSTEENIINSKVILDHHGWDQILIATDSFHMFRAGLILNRYNIDYYRSPVSVSRIGKMWYVRLATRELAAIHWYVFKELFGLSITNL